MQLDTQIEALLFVSAKPVAVGKLAQLTKVKEAAVETALHAIAARYNTPKSGVQLLRVGKSVQFGTNPETRAVVQAYLEAEVTGELTRPQLEALTVIAYRGPIGKTELEKIRGVNCTLILRNLSIRDLVEEREAHGEPVYEITHEFLRYLGIRSPEELPRYGELHTTPLIPDNQPALPSS